MSEQVLITKDNAVELLRRTIEKFGGEEKYYRDRIAAIYDDEHEIDVVSAECYYVAPGRVRFVTDDHEDFEWEPMHDPEPCCLIGCLLVDLGVPKQFFHDRNVNADAVETILNELHTHTNVHITDDALPLLKAAQQAQDNCKPWGAALAQAQALAEMDQ